MSDTRLPDVTRYGEARTGSGQLLQFRCAPERVDGVRRAIEEDVVDMEVPVTGPVKNMPHGGYGKYTRYDVMQHKYAGGGSGGVCGYREILTIGNPPDDRCGTVLYEYNTREGGAFSEWGSLEHALAAWESGFTVMKPKVVDGCLRLVLCGPMQPWFYAIGTETLIGDYVVPYGIEDDPVYRFGRKFVVVENGVQRVVTCMGARIGKRKIDHHHWARAQTDETYRMVYWDDGSAWREFTKDPLPRPLEEGELWIDAAVQQFRELLAGQRERFEIKFTNGESFVGRVKLPSKRLKCPEGEYFLEVQLKEETELRRGWVDFVPTSDAPDVVAFVTKKYTEEGKTVERVEVKESKSKRAGKRWKGVFLEPSKSK